MIGEITNHLWQSTTFAAAIALLATAFSKNRAEVRYWLWLSASLKFLVPFSLLVGVGIQLWDAQLAGKIATHITAPAVAQTMVEFAQPFPATFAQTPSAHHATDWISIAILCLWAFGFFCVALMRCRSWFQIRAAVRASSRHRCTDQHHRRNNSGSLFRNSDRARRSRIPPPSFTFARRHSGKLLRRGQFEAVTAHEQCHIRRRDNLTSACHMIVEAIFWFHPIVWWIGAKLVEEREQACDEAVLKLGNEPEVLRGRNSECLQKLS